MEAQQPAQGESVTNQLSPAADNQCSNQSEPILPGAEVPAFEGVERLSVLAQDVGSTLQSVACTAAFEGEEETRMPNVTLEELARTGRFSCAAPSRPAPAACTSQLAETNLQDHVAKSITRCSRRVTGGAHLEEGEKATSAMLSLPNTLQPPSAKLVDEIIQDAEPPMTLAPCMPWSDSSKAPSTSQLMHTRAPSALADCIQKGNHDAGDIKAMASYAQIPTGLSNPPASGQADRTKQPEDEAAAPNPPAHADSESYIKLWSAVRRQSSEGSAPSLLISPPWSTCICTPWKIWVQDVMTRCLGYSACQHVQHASSHADNGAALTGGKKPSRLSGSLPLSQRLSKMQSLSTPQIVDAGVVISKQLPPIKTAKPANNSVAAKAKGTRRWQCLSLRCFCRH